MSLEYRLVKVEQINFISESSTRCILWLEINKFQQVILRQAYLVKWNKKERDLQRLESVVCNVQSREVTVERMDQSHQNPSITVCNDALLSFDWKVRKWIKFSLPARLNEETCLVFVLHHRAKIFQTFWYERCENLSGVVIRPDNSKHRYRWFR